MRISAVLSGSNSSGRSRAGVGVGSSGVGVGPCRSMSAVRAGVRPRQAQIIHHHGTIRARAADLRHHMNGNRRIVT